MGFASSGECANVSCGVKSIPNLCGLCEKCLLKCTAVFLLHQLVLGIGLYLIPVAPVQWRAAFMPLHVYSGLFIFTAVIATALMGLTEKLIFAL